MKYLRINSLFLCFAVLLSINFDAIAEELIIYFQPGAISTDTTGIMYRNGSLAVTNDSLYYFLNTNDIELIRPVIGALASRPQITANRTGDTVQLSDFSDIYIGQCPGVISTDLLSAVRQAPGIAYAEKNAINFLPLDVQPNDPYTSMGTNTI